MICSRWSGGIHPSKLVFWSLVLLVTIGAVAVVGVQDQERERGGDRVNNDEKEALLREQEEEELEYQLDLILEASASNIQGLSIALATTSADVEIEKEDPPAGIRIDLTDLEFSFFDSNEDSTHGNTIHVEYAVIRVPRRRDDQQQQQQQKQQKEEEENEKATSLITVGQCDERGCDFVNTTEIILEGGIGAKVPSSSPSSLAASYLWCNNDRKASHKNPDLPRNEHIKFGNLIGGGGGDGSSSSSLPYSCGNLKLQGGGKERIPIDDAKIYASAEESSSYDYIIVLANCGESFMDIGKHSAKVEGTIKIWNNNRKTHQSSSSHESSSSSSAKVPTSTATSTSGQTIHQSATKITLKNQQLEKMDSPSSTEESPTPAWQSMMAPLILFGLLGGVLFLKEKEGRDICEEDAYNASNRNAGYKSLPMMDLTTSSSFTR